MNFLIKYSHVIFWVLTFQAQNVLSQNFKYLKSFGTNQGEILIQQVSAEKSGNCSILLQYENNSQYTDTLLMGSYIHVQQKNKPPVIFIVKLDSQGVVTNVRHIFSSSFPRSMCRDDSGNFYVSGTVNGIFDTITLNSSNGGFFIAKYDAELKLVWVKQYGTKSTSSYKIQYSQGKILFICRVNDTTSIGNKKYYFNPNGNNFLFGEIEKVDGKIVWSNFINKSIQNKDYIIIEGIEFVKNNFFIAYDVEYYTWIGKDSISSGGYLAKLDSTGNFLNQIRLNSSIFSKIRTLSTDGNLIYMAIVGSDNLILNNKVIKSQFNSNSGKYSFTIIAFDNKLYNKWYIQPVLIDTSRSSAITDLSITNEGYIYFGGRLYSKIKMGSFSLTPSGSGGDVFMFKLDYMGNIIWAVNGSSDGAGFSDLDAISGKFVFGCGQFKNELKFSNYKQKPVGSKDGWLTKLSDNSIYRGDIKKGPYCAGDTIFVPYSIYGIFDTLNYFIAELSDEDGNFDTIAREIGRIKSNSSGEIIGILPQVKVPTSNKYRIRISSTFPEVQSFYRIDTLRLLIFSQDKAEPGPAETICNGDSIQIRSLGGSVWHWSPNYHINNTSVRKPIVWPNENTVYRIIISDLNGCGKKDTAFKQVFVKPLPKALLKSDTTVCNSNLLRIHVKFVGGDSNFHWSWYYVTPSKWFLLKSGEYAYLDSLTFVPDVQLNSSEKLAIILRDECSSKSDTAYITIRMNSAPKLKQKISDTLVCAGTKLSYSASASGGNFAKYIWQWKDITNNKILSLSDTLNITALKNTSIQLTVNDGCLYLADTGLFHITVNPVLKGEMIHNTSKLNDTLLCFGNTLHLFSTAQGGKGSDYQFEWYLDNSLVSTADTFDLQTSIFFSSAGETKKLKLMVNDHCSPYPDSVLRNILVVPSPQADFTWGITCSNTPVSFTFTGKAPGITKYTWQFHGDSSNQKNPVKTLSAGKNQVQLQLTTQDGCTDNISKEVEVLLQAKADFSANDVCEDSVVIFNNLSKGALSYKWSFGDGQTSDSVSPEHLYSISGSTTFNVKLLAQSGCSDSIIKAVTVHEVPNSNFSYTTSGTQVLFNAKQTNASLYAWDFGDGGTRNTTDPQTTYYYDKFPSGKYTACLKISNLADCFSQTCQDILITGSVKALNDENQVRIYPNPNTGSFTIETNNHAKSMNIRIYNSVGQTIYEVMTDQSKRQFELDLTKGVYLIKILMDNKMYCYPIIVNQ
ncbi:MAG: T9SS type A sorting domain-containing protein [Flavobacteriales bacterium]|nr:T9SS type A sorting domain-containing protein [Flavobacteriales bacterium]